MNSEQTAISLLQLRNLHLKLGKRPTPSIVQLLSNTIWGTPGAMRYQHLDTEKKIRHLANPWFLYLEKEEETVAVVCLDQRKTGGLDAFYIRYFSFAEALRRKGTAEAKAEIPISKGQGIFKRFSSSFFEKPEVLLHATGTEKAIFYAYVELGNARSRDMVSQMGLTECGTFSTLIFSRIFHRKQRNVRRARQDEKAQIQEIVGQTYVGHSFYTAHGLFYEDNYFVLEVDGKIVAGCQAQKVHWRIVDIPGKSGKIMMKTLPWLPLLSRLFNPRKFDFVALEGIFCISGNESALQSLFEGLLAELDLHTGIIWLSKSSPIFQIMQDNVRLGLLQKLRKSVEATVVIRSYGISEDELASIKSQPVYISAFDAT